MGEVAVNSGATADKRVTWRIAYDDVTQDITVDVCGTGTETLVLELRQSNNAIRQFDLSRYMNLGPTVAVTGITPKRLAAQAGAGGRDGFEVVGFSYRT